MKRPVEKRLKEEVAKFFNSHKKSDSFSIDEYAAEFLAQKLELLHEWDIAHLRLMFRALAKLPRDQPFQMFLPGFRGDLGERIPVEKGVRLQIGEATVSDLRENLKVMKSVAKSKLDPKIEERQRFIDDMALYSHGHRGLTVAEYCELKAAGVAPPVAQSAKKKTAKKGKSS